MANGGFSVIPRVDEHLGVRSAPSVAGRTNGMDHRASSYCDAPSGRPGARSVLVSGFFWCVFSRCHAGNGVLSTALLFLSSAMIPPQAIPENMKLVFLLNPLTFIIDQAREVALWGNLPDWSGLSIYLLLAMVAFYGGFVWFRATRKGFADVI